MIKSINQSIVNSAEFGVKDFRGVAHRDGFVDLAGQAVGDAVACPRLSLELRAIGVGYDVLGDLASSWPRP
jgi:hypothetical protein